MVVDVMMRAQGEALAHGVLKLLAQRAAGQGLTTDHVVVRRGRPVPKGGAATLPLPATPRTGCGPPAKLFCPL